MRVQTARNLPSYSLLLQDAQVKKKIADVIKAEIEKKQPGILISNQLPTVESVWLDKGVLAKKKPQKKEGTAK